MTIATLTSCLDYALNYASRGWYVLPVHTPNGSGGCSCRSITCDAIGKHPRTDNGHRDATKDAEQIVRWWRESPDANVGIRTGCESGLAVLDIDPRHGGDESLQLLIAEHGALPHDTPETITGGGGRHIFFRQPHGQEIRCGSLGAGVDLKGDGGFIVAPPSMHASGTPYAWEISSHFADVKLATVPAWISTPRRMVTALAAGTGTIHEGARNIALFSLAGTLQRQGCATILDTLLAENAARCMPPLARHEVEKIAASVSRYTPATSLDPTALTDMGNARRLVELHGDGLRYCEALGGWLVYDGRRWTKDIMGEVMQRAKATATRLYEDIRATTDDAQRRLLAMHAMKSSMAPRLASMITLARSEPSIPAHPDAFDRDPWLLNVNNGVLDLTTGQRRDHRPEDMMTKVAPVDYDPGARCERWLAFLARVTGEDRELQAFLQRMAGYCLTGDTSEHALFMLWGTGRNGKSTFIDVIASMLGDYARATSSDTLLQRRGETISNGVAKLKGARFVSAVEADDGRRLAEAQVKQLTGGDIVSARFLFQEEFEYRPEFKLVIGLNNKPRIAGNDYAIWSRIKLVPFTITIPVEERDPHLREYLKANELSGILRWALEGCLAWQQQRGLRVPDAVTRATSAYREEQDQVGAFLADCCELGERLRVGSTALYVAYTGWCGSRGDRPLSLRELAPRLRACGLVDGRSNSERLWFGVCLLSTTSPEGVDG